MKAVMLEAGFVLATCGTGAAQEPRSVIEQLEQECTGTRECLAVLRDAAIHHQRLLEYKGPRIRRLTNIPTIYRTYQAAYLTGVGVK